MKLNDVINKINVNYFEILETLLITKVHLNLEQKHQTMRAEPSLTIYSCKYSQCH